MFVLTEATTRGHGRIALAEIEAVVAARLGPGRVTGNAQPAVFSRQVAMYVASQVCGWSTTQIGKFYNGRDHSTVCYSIGRIRALRDADPGVAETLTLLSNEIGRRAQLKPARTCTKVMAHPNAARALFEDAVLDAMAVRIAGRVLSLL